MPRKYSLYRNHLIQTDDSELDIYRAQSEPNDVID